METDRPGSPSLLTDYSPPDVEPDRDRVGLHVGLFVATFACMVWCGGLLVGRSALWGGAEGDGTFGSDLAATLGLLADPVFLHDGVVYAASFLLFLTVHEFGHYIAARVRKTRVSLPYYIPIPLPGTLGTLGAVIRIKEPLRRTRQLFDIGAAGPLAGFVVAVGVLLAAVLTLPPPEYLLGVVGHADKVDAFLATGQFPAFDPSAMKPKTMALVLGDTPLFRLITALGYTRIPGDEILHYPLLLAGWFGLFFTALNLLPVGQLDGGHVVYALFGPAVHRVVARVTTILLLLSGGLGLVSGLVGTMPAWQVWLSLALVVALAFARLFEGEWRLVVPAVLGSVGVVWGVVTFLPGLAASVGWAGWLFWVGLILFVIRVDHPPVRMQEPLTPGRKVLGYLCILIFLLCFSIQPLQMY